MPTLEPLADIAATIIHLRGETSMANVPQGDWPAMRAVIDELVQRPGAHTIFIGNVRIEIDNPVPYPTPDFPLFGEAPSSAPEPEVVP